MPTSFWIKVRRFLLCVYLYKKQRKCNNFKQSLICSKIFILNDFSLKKCVLNVIYEMTWCHVLKERVYISSTTTTTTTTTTATTTTQTAFCTRFAVHSPHFVLTDPKLKHEHFCFWREIKKRCISLIVDQIYSLLRVYWRVYEMQWG